MEPGTGEVTKESTILELTLSIGVGLGELQSELNRHFERSDKDCEAKTAVPQNPNILDDILDELKSNMLQLKYSRGFISSMVLNKIH